jgi:hypothetical protein
LVGAHLKKISFKLTKHAPHWPFNSLLCAVEAASMPSVTSNCGQNVSITDATLGKRNDYHVFFRCAAKKSSRRPAPDSNGSGFHPSRQMALSSRFHLNSTESVLPEKNGVSRYLVREPGSITFHLERSGKCLQAMFCVRHPLTYAEHAAPDDSPPANKQKKKIDSVLKIDQPDAD